MGNKLPCSCCENSSTPKNSQMKIIINSDHVSCSCLPSEIDASRCAGQSNISSFLITQDLNNFENLESIKTKTLKNPLNKPRGSSMTAKKVFKENEIKPKKSLTPLKISKNREIPHVTINLLKKVQNIKHKSKNNK